MENIIRVFIPLKLQSKIPFKAILTYFSIISFAAFMIYVSVRVNKYVNNTLSITLIDSPNSNIASDPIITPETYSTVKVQKGDSFLQILNQQKLSNNEIAEIIKLLKSENLVSILQIGQNINFEYEINLDEDKDNDNDIPLSNRDFVKMSIIIDSQASVEITKENNKFAAKKLTIPLVKSLTRHSTKIGSSITSTLRSLGLSSKAVAELINAYSHQIDFQRQLKADDKITVVSEIFSTSEGQFTRHGQIIFASLNLSGKNFNIYRYSPSKSNHSVSFYTENGNSAKRSLLRTPVNVVKISSKFGCRKHPILGYTKMHKGVDFKAPAGTPIFAAGDGVVSKMGWGSGYGNFVQIKHSATLSTLYGHASKLGKNLKLGAKVKQGQVIGYVGMTGHATGPHLHYEVKIDGNNVNPMSIKTSAGNQLAGLELKQFEQFKKKIKLLNNDLSKG